MRDREENTISGVRVGGRREGEREKGRKGGGRGKKMTEEKKREYDDHVTL